MAEATGVPEAQSLGVLTHCGSPEIDKNTTITSSKRWAWSVTLR